MNSNHSPSISISNRMVNCDYRSSPINSKSCRVLTFSIPVITNIGYIDFIIPTIQSRNIKSAFTIDNSNIIFLTTNSQFNNSSNSFIQFNSNDSITAINNRSFNSHINISRDSANIELFFNRHTGIIRIIAGKCSNNSDCIIIDRNVLIGSDISICNMYSIVSTINCEYHTTSD